MNQRKISAPVADAILLLVAVVWGTGFVLVKFSLGTLGPGQIITLRFLVASVIMGLVLRGKLLRIPRATWAYGVLLGCILTGGSLLQTYGMQEMSAGKNAFITGLYIVIVPFLSWLFFRKRPGARAYVAVLVALAGMALLTLDFSGPLALSSGDLLVLCSAFGFAGHIAFTGEGMRRGHDVMQLSFVQMAVTAVLCASVTATREGLDLVPRLNAQNVLACVYMGAVCTCLAFVLQTVGQKYTSDTHASLLLVTESVFGSLFGALFLAERMSMQNVLGCALIMAGILVAELGGRKKAGAVALST